MTHPPPPATVLRVELLNVQPTVWRRVRVPGPLSLGELHDVLQVAMGWEDRQLYLFLIGGSLRSSGSVLEQERERLQGLGDESKWSVGELVRAGVSEFEYVYDLKGEWRHRVVVEAASLGSTEEEPLLCLAGENACPPEDVGGAEGYARFLDAFTDARPRERLRRRRALGGIWDARGFDLNRVNRDLRALMARK